MNASYSLSRFLIVTLLFLFIPFTHVSAAIADWQKGANVMPHTNSDLGSAAMRSSLDSLKSTGANYVGFIIPYYQADQQATTINRGGNTPTDDALISAVTYAHSIGLKVSLKIHLETHDHQWRAYINPTNRDAWFASYKNILLYYGNLAKTHGIEEIVIGTELINMASDTAHPTNTANWKTMIAALRGVYSGKLTYGANWGDGSWTEETNQIKFWDKLDYIGVSAYYWLSPDNPTLEGLKGSWDQWNTRKLQPLAQEWSKPILFTEIGYRSIAGAHEEPWNWWDSGAYDEAEQARDYTALFSYWNTKSHFAGVMLWSWEINESAIPANDLGYTPQKKQAKAVMKEWFTNPPAPTPTNATFSVSGASTAAQLGSQTTVTFTVKNTSSAAADVLIDGEIHSPQYQKIHQEFFASQHFAAGETKTYTLRWTPSANGAHPVMVGVFSNDWSRNYHWNSNVATVTVGSTAPPPSPPPATSTIDIWWPTNGSTVSGTLPFKALLTNRSIDSYDMFWQVDGGQLNSMGSSDVDYPHKEAWVSVNGWNWKNDGTYSITFVAKEQSGAILSQKTILITVAR